MNYRHLRLIGMLTQALYCLAIFVAGTITHITFFYTFIGPAGLLLFIAANPNYYFDFIAVTTIILMVIMALIFSVAVAVFNQSYLIAFTASAIPIACLTTVLLSMEKLKRTDSSYT